MVDIEKKELEEINEFESEENVSETQVLTESETDEVVEPNDVPSKKQKKVKEPKEAKVKEPKVKKSKKPVDSEVNSESDDLHNIKLSHHDHILNHDEYILARALEFSSLESIPHSEISQVALKLPKQIYKPVEFSKSTNLENVLYDQIHYTVLTFYAGICYVYESDVVAESVNSIINDSVVSFFVGDVVTIKHEVRSNEKRTAFEVDFTIKLSNQEVFSFQLANHFDAKNTTYDFSGSKEVLNLLYEYFQR
jgi:hypothetical protein